MLNYVTMFHIKTEDFFEDIKSDGEKRSFTSNHAFDQPLNTGKKKKALGIMKPKLGGVIMKELIKLQTKCIHT